MNTMSCVTAESTVSMLSHAVTLVVSMVMLRERRVAGLGLACLSLSAGRPVGLTGLASLGLLALGAASRGAEPLATCGWGSSVV